MKNGNKQEELELYIKTFMLTKLYRENRTDIHCVNSVTGGTMSIYEIIC